MSRYSKGKPSTRGDLLENCLNSQGVFLSKSLGSRPIIPLRHRYPILHPLLDGAFIYLPFHLGLDILYELGKIHPREIESFQIIEGQVGALGTVVSSPAIAQLVVCLLHQDAGELRVIAAMSVPCAKAGFHESEIELPCALVPYKMTEPV